MDEEDTSRNSVGNALPLKESSTTSCEGVGNVAPLRRSAYYPSCLTRVAKLNRLPT